jgi:hypothetical protein
MPRSRSYAMMTAVTLASIAFQMSTPEVRQFFNDSNSSLIGWNLIILVGVIALTEIVTRLKSR